VDNGSPEEEQEALERDDPDYPSSSHLTVKAYDRNNNPVDTSYFTLFAGDNWGTPCFWGIA
jgi:hypothetical protein